MGVAPKVAVYIMGEAIIHSNSTVTSNVQTALLQYLGTTCNLHHQTVCVCVCGVCVLRDRRWNLKMIRLQ